MLPRTQWTFLSDPYFNLFLPPAPSRFFLPQFLLPISRSHATFTPSSLLISRSLCSICSPPFSSLPFSLLPLIPSIIFLSSPCSSCAAASFPFMLQFLPCLFPTRLIPLLPLSDHFVLGRCLLMGQGVNTYSICYAPEHLMTQENPSWLDVHSCQGRPLCHN